jgi:outer membrane protein OmpA-like peptidoglycan-associated protein
MLTAGAAQAQIGSATSQTLGPYVGIGGGWSHVMPFSDSGSADDLQFHTKPQEGFVVNLESGYDFGRVRLEGELAYRRAAVSKTTVLDGGTKFPALTGATTSSGDVGALAFMANAIVDILPKSPITPYVGAGVGGLRLELENYTVGSTPFVQQSDLTLAYQGIAGVRWQVMPEVSLWVDYRYFAAGMKAGIKDIKGGLFKVPYASHNVMAGIAYHFGAPPPPPPPPMPAPIAAPAPAPAAPAPSPHNFIVYFNFDKYDLTPDARKTIESAAATFKQVGAASIAIAGYTDLSGTALYNMKLSKRRADTVHAYLVQLGVPDAAINESWHGKENPAVPTPDGVREPRNRVVEINLR